MSTRTPNRRPATWADLVLGILREADARGETMLLPALYQAVQRRAQGRLATCPTWKATVRRTVQDLRDKGLSLHVAKGEWQYLSPDQAVTKHRKRQGR